MTTTDQLPLYRCHKLVRAARIAAVGHGELLLLLEGEAATRVVGQAFIDKHQPVTGGYFVVYEDGYESFSPAAAFESGYFAVAAGEPS